MTEKTESAAAVTEESLVATCEGIARDYLAHRGYEVHAGDGWSCDCEDAPIVATDGDETVLIAVISAYEEGSARMPELNVGAAEFAIMRRACLLYLADHGDMDAIRHDVVSIVVTGERQVVSQKLV
jgi:putative endonuclease